MPGTLKLQVTLPMTSALPEDAVTNTFHWNYSAGGGTATAQEACDALEVFYTALRPYFANNVDFANARFKAYDLAHPEPRAPVLDVPLVVTGSNTDDPLPAEVALCVSWTADNVSGGVMARRRGRTYIGPLGRGTQDAADRRHPDNDIVDAFSTAGGTLASFAGTLGQLAIYSPTDGIARDVTGGWVDNAYDTVRSRGVDATYRNPF